ncbi:SGNH/GDSL hydrolase family protein [Nocardia sp. NPDC006044]|uniref:SGNH/GDSL hydrolase family protein n=1 Tax=Nocardia sp. NPDC006044 TaxID=3364306 RepID=UPI0036B2FD9E
MPIALQNLIVLGDSLSDVGNKREAPTGLFARAIKAMRTNEIGRYSDGKNWTDFLIEWTGADPLVQSTKELTEQATLYHRSLSKHSLLLKTDVDANPPVRYANYAEGGAIAGSDWSPKAGALGYLKTQVTQYIKARKALGDQYTGDTMHIIWIGLNDIVTAERAEGNVMTSADGAFEVPRGMKDKAGTGITPVVAEIKGLVDSIANAFPGPPDRNHFMLIDLPSPTVSIRFQDQIADGKRKQVDQFSANTARFNEVLDYFVRYWPMTAKDPQPGATQNHVKLVRMCDWMTYVADNAKAFDLTGFAQLHGVSVPYLGEKDTVEPAIRRCLTTSDLAHPTQAVYELIARKIADDLLDGYTLGRLNAQSWKKIRPYADV